MADSKKSGGNATATKAATPKSIPAQGPGDLDDVLMKAIGTRYDDARAYCRSTYAIWQYGH